MSVIPIVSVMFCIFNANTVQSAGKSRRRRGAGAGPGAGGCTAMAPEQALNCFLRRGFLSCDDSAPDSAALPRACARPPGPVP